MRAAFGNPNIILCPRGTAPAGSADVHVRVTATDPGGLSASYAYWVYTNSAPAVASLGIVTTNVASGVTPNDSADDIALQAVPEPGSLLLLAGGFVLCAVSRRRAGAAK